MKAGRLTGHRGAAAVVLTISGGALAAATWISGDHGFAIGVIAFYFVAAGIAYLWAGGPGDVAAIMRAAGDERQRGLDRDATAITGLVLVLAAIAGAIVEVGRTGNPGAYGILCAVGGVSYTVSLISLRHRH
jgi:hypothetical protein